MQIGIFARTFSGPSIEKILDVTRSHDLYAVHFNLQCAGTDSLPKIIDDRLCQQVREAFEKRAMEMIAISGTFNAIHPDKKLRDQLVDRTSLLIERCRDLGTSTVSLCTGTRDSENMWRRHPDNDEPEAWQDLITTLEKLIPVAENNNVVLGIEPEKANVINSAVKARRLLDEMQSPQLKIIIDGANLFEPEELSRMREVINESIELLGQDIIMAHAKDIPIEQTDYSYAAGTGALDWPSYFQSLAKIGFMGPVVLHNLKESQVDMSRDFVLSEVFKSYSQSNERNGNL